jgi:hypothetical protein
MSISFHIGQNKQKKIGCNFSQTYAYLIPKFRSKTNMYLSIMEQKHFGSFGKVLFSN